MVLVFLFFSFLVFVVCGFDRLNLLREVPLCLCYVFLLVRFCVGFSDVFSLVRRGTALLFLNFLVFLLPGPSGEFFSKIPFT